MSSQEKHPLTSQNQSNSKHLPLQLPQPQQQQQQQSSFPQSVQFQLNMIEQQNTNQNYPYPLQEYQNEKKQKNPQTQYRQTIGQLRQPISDHDVRKMQENINLFKQFADEGWKESQLDDKGQKKNNSLQYSQRLSSSQQYKTQKNESSLSQQNKNLYSSNRESKNIGGQSQQNSTKVNSSQEATKIRINNNTFYEEGNKKQKIQTESFANQLVESERKMYEEYQPIIDTNNKDNNNNMPNSSDSQSQRSTDSQASFAKMNARRTMLLSDDFYGSNQYTAIINQLSSQQCKVIQQCSKRIVHLQNLLKRQCLLLQFQQKTKNQRIKQIQYSYINAFNNFLCLRNVKNSYLGLESNPILLNSKDLFQIHEEFLDDLRRFKEIFGKVLFNQMKNQEIQFKKSVFVGSSSRMINVGSQKSIPAQPLNLKTLFSSSTNKQQFQQIPPPQSFLIDFHNFFPCWADNIALLMQLQFQSHQKIQSTFQSQYTLPSKILSSIKYKDNIYRFCQIIFKKPLQELKKVKTQLIVDFSQIYEKWSSLLFNIPNTNPFKQFLQGKYVMQDPSVKGAIIQQISKFFNQKMDFSQYQKLLIQLNHFAKNRNAMNFLFSQIGRQQIQGESINLRLALLVYKKIQINRRKLQQLSLMFIDQMIQNYQEIPIQIKYIVQVFKALCRKKLSGTNHNDKNFQIKFQDLKSFFNKIIFSQLFFSTFMQLHDEQNYSSGQQKSIQNDKKGPSYKIDPSQSYHSHNITMIALISQKIMFGQQFYQKFKYGYFNNIISEYRDKIKSFIQKFGQKQTIKFQKYKQVNCMFVSIETIKYLYRILRRKQTLPRELESFQKRLMPKKNQLFSLGSSKYTYQKMYIMLMYKPQFNYLSIFKPKDKFKRTFIEFLMQIETINEGITFRQILEQYKCSQQNHDNNKTTYQSQTQTKPSIQIYSNYLSSYQKSIQNQLLIQQIQSTISKTKQYVQKVKISLQKQHNISMNLQKLYKNLMIGKKKSMSKEMLQDYINLLYNLPLEFDYIVINGKICENQVGVSTGKGKDVGKENKKKERSIKDCLVDIASFFGKDLEGLDGLYALLLEKIVNEVQKHNGVMDQYMIQSTQDIIGQRLYKMINLNNIQSQKDRKLFNSMKKHKFLNLKVLALPQYIDQQQIILQLSLQYLQLLKKPMSPDKMLQLFNNVTTVFQNVIMCVGKASDITSDIQIPLMELVLIKSMIPNLSTIVEFIKLFTHNDSGSNKFGMVLALVESICFLIENMSAQHLGMNEAEYVGYIQNEYIIIDS